MPSFDKRRVERDLQNELCENINKQNKYNIDSLNNVYLTHAVCLNSHNGTDAVALGVFKNNKEGVSETL